MRSWLVMGWERCSRKATRRCGREGSIAAAFSLALSVALAGCTIDADYEDTSFACEVSGECPAGFECAGGRCVPPGGGDAAGTHADALPAVDSGTADAEAADSCGSPEPIGAIADEFEGSDVEPLWQVDTGGGAILDATGGQLSIELSQAGGAHGTLASRCGYDLDGGRALIEISQTPDAGEAFFELEATGGGITGTFSFSVQGGSLTMRALSDGGESSETSSFDPVSHRFLAISADGGEVVHETSPDGTSWTPRRTFAFPGSAVADTRVRLGLRATAPGQDGDAARFERFAGEAL